MKNNIIQKVISEYNVISENPDGEVWEKIENRINAADKNKVYRKRYRLRNALATIFVVTIVFALSAFAAAPYFSSIWEVADYGAILETIIIDGFEVNKIEKVEAYHDYANSKIGGVSYHQFTDPVVLEMNNALTGEIEQLEFDTVEEAAKYLPFTPKKLNYIPKGYVLEFANTAKDEHDNYANHCHIRYDNGHSWIHLNQQYVGKNASIQINTTGDIEKTTLSNGIEAILIKTVWTDRNNIVQYRLCWINDYIAYDLTGYLDRDEMIKMAESVG